MKACIAEDVNLAKLPDGVTSKNASRPADGALGKLTTTKVVKAFWEGVTDLRPRVRNAGLIYDEDGIGRALEGSDGPVEWGSLA